VKIGLKLYSTDTGLIADAGSVYGRYFDYIELYIVPGTYSSSIKKWKSTPFPYVIHAPHSFHGVNLARQDFREANRVRINEARRFADDLRAGTIIVHGGHSGSFRETLDQLLSLNDERFALENKPVRGLYGETCVGSSTAELALALEMGAVKETVLDFVHAGCAALSYGREPMALVKDFLAFNPRVFHLSDGDPLSEKDTHYNFGKGNLDIPGFAAVIPEEGLVTIEAPRDPERGLESFIEDSKYLKSVINESGQRRSFAQN
jgi:sugar phosphate isomerase/epimerase